MDKSLRISKDESQKLQQLIDEHLRANGITSLLDEPISIMDIEKFQAEIENTKNCDTKELKITNRLKHTIQASMDSNPDFYKPLADKLEELIKARKSNRISQLEFFMESDKIQNKIINKHGEAEGLGFKSEYEFALFKTLETKLDGADGNAKEVTYTMLKAIEDELSIADWQSKYQVMKSMRVKIKDVLRGKVESNEVSPLTATLVDIIKRN
jgi:type I restriction enzyme R subunit